MPRVLQVSNGYKEDNHSAGENNQNARDRPWQDLHVALDLLRPMPTGGNLLVQVDYFSPWVEVDIIRSTTSEMIIKCLDKHLSRCGVPSTLRTENGPNMVSAEMEERLNDWASSID